MKNLITIGKIRIITVLFALLIMPGIINGQDADKTVTIKVSGSGNTQDEAKQSALRSGIEQAYGVFISSKTEIFNDELVADEIASVANGNIQSYEIMNESQLPDGSWGVTLRAVVSVSKLKSFAEAKGIAIEIKGGLFAANIKQQLLNEQGEFEAIYEMLGLLHEPLQTSFDYFIKNGDPVSLDSDSRNWKIPLKVTVIANKNMDFCADYCIKTLSALSLSSEEVSSYNNLNKHVCDVSINYNGIDKIFYLRNGRSIRALETFFSNWEFYTRLFNVKTAFDELNGEEIIDWQSSNKLKIYGEPGYYIKLNFLTKGQLVSSYSWEDERTLFQIEQMSGYTIKPRGVVSHYKHGGFVIYEKNGHGLVASITNLGEMKFSDAKTACAQLNVNGYSDWHLPTIDELNSVYINLFKRGAGGGVSDFWSSTVGETWLGGKYVIALDCFGKQKEIFYEQGFETRAVRTF